MGKVDLSDDPNRRQLLSRFEVRAFPTIKVFRNGVVDVSSYRGSHDAAEIVDYLVAEKAKEQAKEVGI